MVNCIIYIEGSQVKISKYRNIVISFSEDRFSLADPDEVPYSVAFHLGLPNEIYQNMKPAYLCMFSYFVHFI